MIYAGERKVSRGIVVKRGTSIEDADRIAEEVKENVSRETGCQYCIIHIDPEPLPESM